MVSPTVAGFESPPEAFAVLARDRDGRALTVGTLTEAGAEAGDVLPP